MSYLFSLSAFCHNVTPRHYQGKQVWHNSFCLPKLSGGNRYGTYGTIFLQKYSPGHNVSPVSLSARFADREHGVTHVLSCVFCRRRTTCHTCSLECMVCRQRTSYHTCSFLSGLQAGNMVSHLFLPECFAGKKHGVTPVPFCVFCRQKTWCHTCSFLSVLQEENMVSHLFIPECFCGHRTSCHTCFPECTFCMQRT